MRWRFFGRLRQRDSTPTGLPTFMERHAHPRGFTIDRHHDFGFAGRQVNRFHWDRKIVGNLCERNALPGRAEFQGHKC